MRATVLRACAGERHCGATDSWYCSTARPRWSGDRSCAPCSGVLGAPQRSRFPVLLLAVIRVLAPHRPLWGTGCRNSARGLVGSRGAAGARRVGARSREGVPGPIPVLPLAVFRGRGVMSSQFTQGRGMGRVRAAVEALKAGLYGGKEGEGEEGHQ